MDIALKSSEKMNKLIDPPFHYSRTGALAEEAEEVGLETVINDVKIALGQSIQNTKDEIILKSEIENIKFYQILFYRLPQNLISNAIKYQSDKNPYITFTAVNKEEDYHFSINDNGIGIKESDY
jgi:light-regulated signal transduction histidine kinase (bacteriophytochrome)